MLDQQVAEGFIGRQKELDIFKWWLNDTGPSTPWILHFYDAFEPENKKGGVGKTWLLRKCVNLAKQYKDIAVIEIDFFNVAQRDGLTIAENVVKKLQETYPRWIPTTFNAALREYESATSRENRPALHEKLAQAIVHDLHLLDQKLDDAKKHLIIFFDTFELIEQNPLIAELRSGGTFPDNYQFQHTGVVMAGRNSLDMSHPNWQGREDEIYSVALEPFTLDEMVRYLNTYNKVLDTLQPQSEKVILLHDRTEGRPILVGLASDILNYRILTIDQLTSVPQANFEATLVGRINDIREPINWIILFMAHVYHRFNYAILDWIFNKSMDIKNLMQDVHLSQLERELLNLSFVRSTGLGKDFVLHDEMRRLVMQHSWPKAVGVDARRYQIALSQAMVSYYENELERVTDIQLRQNYLIETLYHKLFLNVDVGFKYFERHFYWAIPLLQTAFARSLLKEVQKFALSQEQQYVLKLAEAILLRQENNAAEALKLYQELEQQADEHWFTDHSVKIYFERAIAYQRMNNLVEARNWLARALEFEAEQEHEVHRAEILAWLGYIHRRLGELEKAEQFYKESSDIYKKHDNQAGYANAIHGLGILYRLQGKMDEALHRCMSAWRIRKELYERGGSEVAVGMSLSAIGSIYFRSDELVMASNYFAHAMDIFERNNFKQGIASMYCRFGQIALARNELDQAMDFFQKGYTASKGLDDAETEINSLNKLGWVHVQQGLLQESIVFFEEAIKIAQRVNDHYQQAESLIDLADVYQRAGKLGSFEQTLGDALKIAQQYHYYYLLGLAEDFQGDNKYKAGDYLAAFDHFVRACYYTRAYNPLQYEKTVRKITNRLFELDRPKSEIFMTIGSLVTKWSELVPDERSSPLLYALEEVKNLM